MSSSFFSMDPQHISRLLGAVAGMDKELEKKGLNPDELRSEFWERFGDRIKKTIKSSSGVFRFDPHERINTRRDCGSCGSIDIAEYEIKKHKDDKGLDRFYICKYVKSISTHMGSELEKEEDVEFYEESRKPLDMIQFIADHGATVVSLSDVFDWVDIIKALKQ